MSRQMRDFWYRLSAASKFEFGTNLLNIVARAFQVLFVIEFSTAKYTGATITKKQLAFLVISLLYSAVHPMLPKVRKRKWIEEDVRRARSISVAVSRIAAGISADQLREVELHQVSHGLLVAIRSEIETLVLDTEGIYIDVNLLVPDPSSDARLLVLNRANPYRHLNVSYKKEGMLVWETMQTGRYAYEPDFKSDDEKPYRSILAFPLIFENKDRTVKALGGISIDSSKAHHFDGLEKRLETKLLPYLTLLKLVLVCRGRYEGNR